MPDPFAPVSRLFHPVPRVSLGTFGPPPFRVPVALPVAKLTEHLHVVGTSGGGKSRTLAHLALSLIARGEGITLLDPHGDLAGLVFRSLVARGLLATPEDRERITYLDLPAAARVGRSTALDVTALPFDTPVVASLVLEALRRAWPALGGGVAPAFENAVLAGVSVLRHHRLPLVFLHDLLTDDAWRRTLLAPVTDPATRGFFARMDGWSGRERSAYLESTLRRAFLLTFSPALRHALGQAGDTVLHFRGRFDQGESLVVNLALPDPDARHLIGSLLTVFAEQGARSRADGLAGTRRGHTVVLDEFADLSARSGESLLRILEECRKFGVGLVLAHQSLGQLPGRMAASLAGVGTMLAFRVGRDDAETLARHLGSIHVGAVKAPHPTGTGMPAFFSPAEQWEWWARHLQRLKPRHALVTRPKGRTATVRTMPLPDPVVPPDALAETAEWYLTHRFSPGVVVEAELAQLRPAPTTPTAPRRTRRSL